MISYPLPPSGLHLVGEVVLQGGGAAEREQHPGGGAATADLRREAHHGLRDVEGQGDGGSAAAGRAGDAGLARALVDQQA